MSNIINPLSNFHLDILLMIIIGSILLVVLFILLFVIVIVFIDKCCSTSPATKRNRAHYSDSDDECNIVIIPSPKKLRRSPRLKKMYNHLDYH